MPTTMPSTVESDDAEDAHQQRIKQAGQQRTGEGVAVAVGDQRLAEVEAGGVLQEAEPQRHALAGERVGHVAEGQVEQAGDDRDHDHLNRSLDEAVVAPEGAAQRPRGQSNIRHCFAGEL
jgi:hypothetical protein